MTKVSVEEQKELISDNSVRAAFHERADIASLPAEEQEARWQEHAVKLEEFRGLLSQKEWVPCAF